MLSGMQLDYPSRSLRNFTIALKWYLVLMPGEFLTTREPSYAPYYRPTRHCTTSSRHDRIQSPEEKPSIHAK